MTPSASWFPPNLPRAGWLAYALQHRHQAQHIGDRDAARIWGDIIDALSHTDTPPAIPPQLT